MDSATSVQIMEILKEISKDKLVIMVTHNPQLADEYSSRIIRLKDGTLVSDSNLLMKQKQMWIRGVKKTWHVFLKWLAH